MTYELRLSHLRCMLMPQASVAVAPATVTAVTSQALVLASGVHSGAAATTAIAALVRVKIWSRLCYLVVTD